MLGPARVGDLTTRQVVAYRRVMAVDEPTRPERGVVAAAAYLPHWRLDRSAVGAVLGSAQGSGTRSVAGYDEDPLTMAVAAGRRVLAATERRPDALWFATTAPVYAEKTSAPIAHSALRLDPSVMAADAGPGLRGASAALRSALMSAEPATLVLAGDVRCGPAGSADERDGGDGAAALLIGSDDDGDLAAEYLGGASATGEFLDRWKAPGELRTHAWEERFGQQRYGELLGSAWAAACKDAGVEQTEVTAAALVGMHPRAAAKLSKSLSADGVTVVDSLTASIGFCGAAHGPVMLTHLIEQAATGDVVALASMADGADVFLFRVTGQARRNGPTVAEDIGSAHGDVPYARYLQWRGVLPVQPPNRPEPARMSASAAGRRGEWKYGFVGSRDRSSGAVHLPPARVSFDGGAVDDMEPAAMADSTARVITYTIDSLAYSPSPPTIFAVCDFEGGGRLPLELTDVAPADVRIGMEVEMTFRRINTADGIANYFWKAKPASGADDQTNAEPHTTGGA